ncbi:MAG: ribulokinase [Solirubrobacterales bacterium]|nr:ribulokinase [Solirubrobacterales bacterium]MBV9715191.1 ribulokinase [Solirubrobacterales bacterium]
MGDERHVIGIDFGTLSGRAVVVRAGDGEELGSAEYKYPHGVMDRELAETGERLPPDWALQDPQDYIDVLRHAVPEAVKAAGVDPASVVGIGTDFTSCTIMPTRGDGTPLCRLDEFRGRPHAYAKLWKHHAAQPQADRVTEVAAERGEPWLSRYGGRISSEWAIAKALQVLEEDTEIYDRMERWIEAGDWIVWQLCGEEVRSACPAGYKAMYQDGRYPDADYFEALDARFRDFAEQKLGASLAELGARAGTLTDAAAEWTGLKHGIAVAVGNVDAHVTAPAAQATDPGRMVVVMGTSNCHVIVGDELAEVPGMCGVVKGGLVPGRWGYEAGQTGVGDIFAWFVDQAVPPYYHEQARDRGLGIHQYLTELADEQEVGEHGLVALDWWNGNRSILVDHNLRGVLVGMSLATRPEDIYRALIESTAFGTRKIIEAFGDAGVTVDELVTTGGLLDNPVLMQIYTDVVNRPLGVLESAQGPALGSAIHAAVAAGVHEDIETAAARMGKVRREVYSPNPRRAEAYDRVYRVYGRLHDWFGRESRDLMADLQSIAADARKGERVEH